MSWNFYSFFKLNISFNVKRHGQIVDCALYEYFIIIIIIIISIIIITIINKLQARQQVDAHTHA